MIKYSAKPDRRKKAPGLCAARYVYTCYRLRMQYRDLGFNITFEEFLEMTQKNCFYCGKEPEQISRKQNANGIYIYNGLDRVDNNKGYIKGNCVPCCQRCNGGKKAMLQRDFAKWIKAIYENWAKDVDTEVIDKPIVTIGELSQLLKISKRTIYGWVRNNDIPYLKLGGCIRFKLKAIESWLMKKSNAGRTKGKVEIG